MERIWVLNSGWHAFIVYMSLLIMCLLLMLTIEVFLNIVISIVGQVVLPTEVWILAIDLMHVTWHLLESV